MLRALELLLKALLAKLGADLLFQWLNYWMQTNDFPYEFRQLQQREAPVEIRELPSVPEMQLRSVTDMDFEDDGYIWDQPCERGAFDADD